MREEFRVLLPFFFFSPFWFPSGSLLVPFPVGIETRIRKRLNFPYITRGFRMRGKWKTVLGERFSISRGFNSNVPSLPVRISLAATTVR